MEFPPERSAVTQGAEPKTMNRKGILYLLFFLSGVAGLLYEVVWNHLLILVFGGSSYATATVLASFMSGLALGSWLFGRRADRTANPLRLYGRIEIGIAVAALLVPLFVLAGRWAFVRIAPGLEGSALFIPIRYAIAFVALLLPTTLMGGTFPVMSRALVSEVDRVGKAVGLLYFLNTGGAVLGALAAAFLALPILGVYGSIAAGVVVNLVVGAGVLALSGNAAGAPADIAPVAGDERVVPDRDARPLHTMILILFALSGFASLGYEVAWVRALVFFLGNNTVFAFAIMLATFLTGLAIGGALYSVLFFRARRKLLLFGLLELGIGLAALLTLHLFGDVNSIILFFVERSNMRSWGSLLFLRAVVCAVIMFLPTLLIGATFPAVTHAITATIGRVGREVGTAYALNTVGAILGSLAAGFVLVPAIGLERTLIFLTSINLAIAAIVFLAAGRGRVSGAVPAVVVAAAIILLMRGETSERFPAIYQSAVPGQNLVYYEEGASSTVTVHQDPGRKTKLLCVNGVWEVPTDFPSLQVFKLLGHVGPILHPEPREGLAIALGGGIALGSLALHPFDEVTCVEICPEVRGGAALFAEENNRVLENERVRVVFNDGRNRLLLSDRLYDVIISDATHPSSAESWVLYTKDFYRLVLSRLGEEGVFCQWLPYHGVDEETYRTILRTFHRSFPHSALFALARHSILVGSPDPIVLDMARAQERLEHGEVRADLASVDLDDPVRIVAALSLLDEKMGDVAGTGVINTDAHPRNSFAEARGHSGKTLSRSLSIARSAEPDPALYCRSIEAAGLDTDSLRSVVARIRGAWDLDRQAFALDKQKRGGEAQRAWTDALRMDPENRGIARIYGEALVTQAIQHIRAGDFGPVVPIFRKLVRVVPWEGDSHFRLANHLYREGRVLEAIAEYKEGLRLDPSNEVVRKRLARILAELGIDESGADREEGGDR